MLVNQPKNVEEVQSWLRRVQLFEEVNWDITLPDYSAVKNLTDVDFVWNWTPSYTRQYNAAAQMTGILHMQGLVPQGSLLPDRPSIAPSDNATRRTAGMNSDVGASEGGATAFSPLESDRDSLETFYHSSDG